MTPFTAWRPARTVFLRRAAIVAGLTFVIALGLLLVLNQFWQANPMISVFLAFIAAFAGVFEDALTWRRIRSERWSLDGPSLIHDGSDGRAMILRSDIADVAARRNGTVILYLHSGKRIAMRYLANPQAIAKTMRPAPTDPHNASQQ